MLGATHDNQHNLQVIYHAILRCSHIFCRVFYLPCFKIFILAHFWCHVRVGDDFRSSGCLRWPAEQIVTAKLF